MAEVNVGSAGASGWPYMALYAASKAALHAASIALDREYSSRGVRVLSVEVGNTAGTEFASGFDPEHFAAAMRLWTEIGIEWSSSIVTPEESARRILGAVEAALA
jgi:NAD(P)-dependent dehydrogenase (short-subunit alcohol dehydrogenase family)